MAKAVWKPIIPQDWVGLEMRINEIWRLLNANITITEINDDILDAVDDIATNAAAISALQSTVSGLDAIAGSNKQIQYNDGGVHGADADLTFDKTTKTLTTQRIKAKRILAGGVH